MCGITGFYHFRSGSAPISKQCLEEMSLEMTHRGPDNQGYFYQEQVGLAHNRLSIIDLSTSANQPFSLPDQSVVMVYNGEVYNFLDLKQDLQREGVEFETTSDTEVVFQAYLRWGEDSFSKLNGMYAFAIWDQRQDKEAFYLVRDRFGIKPVYISVHQDQTLLFGSEIKSILKSQLVPSDISPQGLQEYLWYGNALGDSTLYDKVKKLRPGHFLKANRSGIQVHQYWNAESLHTFEEDITLDEAIAQVRNLLTKAIQRQLISDVPVGVFLSGGIDSSAVTAIASQHYGKKLDTFSVDFDVNYFGKGELDNARLIANRFGTNHHEVKVEAFGLQDVIETLVRSHDEPFGNAANLPLYLLSKQIKGQIKVVLQGDGGDEIFAGYRRYNMLDWHKLWTVLSKTERLWKKVPFKRSAINRLERMLSIFGDKNDAHMMARLLTTETNEYPPESVLSRELREKIKGHHPFREYERENSRFAHKDILQRMLFLDTQLILPNTYLEKVDKSTMANSLEVRVPFLDHDLTEYVMRLPSSLKVKQGQKKWLLRSSLRGIVPDEILDSPKRGFGVPFGTWIGTTLADYFQDVLNDQKVRESGWFNHQEITRCLQQHKRQLQEEQNNQGKGYLLWKILHLALWYREYH